MRHEYLCIAAILTLTALGGAALHPANAGSGRLLANTENSPVYSISLRKRRWDLPEFRMAGREAFVIVRIENTRDHTLHVSMRCRTRDGAIPEMSGTHRVMPGEFMYFDTRKLRDPIQRGEGVRVKCRFRANGSAKVEAWIYDEEIRVAGRRGTG
ncbi:MAG: hypothetical protein ACOC91_02355 [bacterium]